MSFKKEIIESMEHGIAKNMRVKAAGNEEALAVIEKIFEKAEELPESYYKEKVLPGNGAANAGAFMEVWKELAAEVMSQK